MGCAELPKLQDDGTNNNYGSWKNQAYYKLQEWGLWKYIKGPGSKPPTIPILHLTVAYHSLNDNGHITMAHIQGNEEEYEVAVTATEPWHTRMNWPLAESTTPSQSKASTYYWASLMQRMPGNAFTPITNHKTQREWWL